MTNSQESRLSMYLAFKDFQAAYTTITNPLPNYSANSAIFLATIPKIQVCSEQQKSSKKGVVDVKNQSKESLIVTTADYARKLATYAKFTNNATLAQDTKITESKLRKIADTAVRDYAQMMYNRAQPIIANLAAYGITAATQSALANNITAYNASIGKPNAVKVEGSLTTKQLAALFDTADKALDNMDAAVEIVRLTQVNFYNGYKSARKVIETGTGSLAVKGTITDIATGEPLKGVNLSFALDGMEMKSKSAKSSTTESIVKKTADKGGFNIKTLPEGVYSVTIKKIGYADHVTTISVANGELTVLNVQLSKN